MTPGCLARVFPASQEDSTVLFPSFGLCSFPFAYIFIFFPSVTLFPLFPPHSLSQSTCLWPSSRCRHSLLQTALDVSSLSPPAPVFTRHPPVLRSRSRSRRRRPRHNRSRSRSRHIKAGSRIASRLSVLGNPAIMAREQQQQPQPVRGTGIASRSRSRKVAGLRTSLEPRRRRLGRLRPARVFSRQRPSGGGCVSSRAWPTISKEERLTTSTTGGMLGTIVSCRRLSTSISQSRLACWIFLVTCCIYSTMQPKRAVTDSMETPVAVSCLRWLSPWTCSRKPTTAMASTKSFWRLSWVPSSLRSSRPSRW